MGRAGTWGRGLRVDPGERRRGGAGRREAGLEGGEGRGLMRK